MTAGTLSHPAAVTLLSGGLDSCVATAEAVERHGTRVAVLHVSYGQRTARREGVAASRIADHFGLTCRLTADVGYLAQIGGSSLVDPALAIPAASDGEALPTTYVPFRNGNLLAIAVAWAEALGATEIFCGAHGPGSAYPDTQPAFFQAFQRLVDCATPAGIDIRLHAPLLHLDKAAIVARGIERGAPLELTWSCYAAEKRPCGRCHSCHLRQQGFAAAGVPDPLTAGGRSRAPGGRR